MANSFVKVPQSKFSEFTNVIATVQAGMSLGNIPLNDELVEHNGARSRFIYHFQQLRGTRKEFEHRQILALVLLIFLFKFLRFYLNIKKNFAI